MLYGLLTKKCQGLTIKPELFGNCMVSGWRRPARLPAGICQSGLSMLVIVVQTNLYPAVECFDMEPPAVSQVPGVLWPAATARRLFGQGA